MASRVGAVVQRRIKPKVTRTLSAVCFTVLLGWSFCPGAQSLPAGEPALSRLYRGSEKGAPWREAAEKRIEEVRKGDLLITVTDSAGKPVEGATIHCRMTRHAFGFGTAISLGTLLGEGPNYDQYRNTIEENFNKVTFENELKWPQWEQQTDRKQLLRALQWLKERNIAVRGHVLVWPSWGNVPRRLTRYRLQPERLQDEVNDHIRQQVQALSAWVDEWDVVNEYYQHRDLTRVVGRSSMAQWFQTAHDEDPSARLFYNDYVMFKGTRRGEPGRHTLNTLSFLKAERAPIHGLGEQGHFGDNPPSPDQVLRAFDEFSKTGLRIQITEFDIDSADALLQRAFMRDFLTAAFSHPAVESFTLWGFWENRHWKPRAALWRKDWSLRPHGEVFTDLVKKKWWTDVVTVSGSNGQARVRGFCGDYVITAADAEPVVMSLPRSGASVAIRLKN